MPGPSDSQPVALQPEAVGDVLAVTLRLIEEGVAARSGDTFFRLFVRRLAEATKTRWAFVSELVGERAERARIFTMWNGNAYEPSFEYALTETPCERAVANGIAFYPAGVQALFPNDAWLRDIGAESYLAVALFASDGQPIGHLGVLHDAALDEELPRADILRVFAARAAAELERTRAERLLRQSEERYRRLVEASPDVIAQIRTGPNGHSVEYINPAVERVLGYLPDEFYADPDLFLRIVGEDEVEDLAEVVRGAAFYESSLRHWRHKDGREVWAEHHNLPVHDEAGNLVAIESVARDVTKRVLAEQALQERESLQRAFLAAIPDVLFRMAPNGSGVRFLPTSAAPHPFGPIDTETEQRLEDIVPPAALPDAKEALRTAQHGGGVQAFQFTVEADDLEYVYEARLAPTPAGDVVGIVRDVTAASRLRAENGYRSARDVLEGTVERDLRSKNPYSLSFREFTVLHLIADGLTDKEIAQRLALSTFTASKHVSNILGKMGAASRTEASVRALQEGLITQ